MLEWTRFRIHHLLYLASMVLFVTAGASLGMKHGGAYLAVAGAVTGAAAGHVVGNLPARFFFRLMMKRIEESSDEGLKEMLKSGSWNFYQTLALLQLAARDVDVREYLPRILRMLESDDKLIRRYGWDALKLCYPEEAARIDEYDAKGDVSACTKLVESLKASER